MVSFFDEPRVASGAPRPGRLGSRPSGAVGGVRALACLPWALAAFWLTSCTGASDPVQEATPGSFPSCEGLPKTCGANQDTDCCSSLLVPGGTYERGDPDLIALDGPAPATVSSFELEEFEVTVGRFRRFMRIYDAWRAAGNPVAGMGAHPSIEGTGWNPEWPLAMHTSELFIVKQCLGGILTWTETEGEHETLPINCINWFEAFAFCAWDGGRIATETEWQYAAAGGDENRAYPWGSTLPADDSVLANHGCFRWGSEECALEDIGAVGSIPAGVGRFGHSDLGGNIYEWTLDTFKTLQVPCVDCALLTTDPGGKVFRTMRGGSWSHHKVRLSNTIRYGDSAGGHGQYTGIRCARDLPEAAR